MPRQAYLGKTDRAHRLNAARRAAGFASVHAAAARFGWSLATYRAHEGATRYLDERSARRYAEAFGVDMDWLWSASGPGPELDSARVALYEAREDHAAKRLQSDPAERAFIRLRTARRLAGYWSMTEAAAIFGLKRTTLAAHESGQNRISPRMANLYGEAFGVHPDWLRSGLPPSGYPPKIDRILDHLGRMHDDSEASARMTYPPWTSERSSRSPDITEVAVPSKQSLKEVAGDAVPEFSVQQVERAMTSAGLGDPSLIHPQRVWWFPERFLLETWSCEPKNAVIFVVTKTSRTSAAGDRVIVDTSLRNPISGRVYAILGVDGIVTTEFETTGPNVIGRACGILGHLRGGG